MRCLSSRRRRRAPSPPLPPLVVQNKSNLSSVWSSSGWVNTQGFGGKCGQGRRLGLDTQSKTLYSSGLAGARGRSRRHSFNATFNTTSQGRLPTEPPQTWRTPVGSEGPDGLRGPVPPRGSRRPPAVRQATMGGARRARGRARNGWLGLAEAGLMQSLAERMQCGVEAGIVLSCRLARSGESSRPARGGAGSAGGISTGQGRAVKSVPPSMDAEYRNG